VSSTRKVRIALVGGGTGGHVSPALAVAHALGAAGQDVQPWLATGRKPVESEWARGVQPPPVRLTAAPMPYGINPVGLARALGAAALGALQAVAWWRRWRPDAMLAMGGYVSVPAVLAARLLRVPYACHVSDALPDRSARRLARRARLVTVNYAEAAEAFPGVRVEVTGQPVRPWILGASREEAARELGLQPDRTTLVVMGGSQGARTLNRAVVAAAGRLMREGELQVLHLVGSLDYEEVSRGLQAAGVPGERYRAFAFLHQMQWALALADVAVTRCGANGLAEFAAARTPMVMIPYPHAGGHQRLNAEPLRQAGAGVIVEDAELTGDRLADEVLAISEDQARRREMAAAARRWARPEAAAHVARLLLELAGHPPGQREE